MNLKFLQVIDNLFTENECKIIIDWVEKSGLEEVDKGIAQYYRNIFKNEQLANILFMKIRQYLPNQFNGSTIVGLNKTFRISKYYPGQYFDIHKDGFNVDSQGNRSVMTLNIFLNNNFSGGETDFFLEDKQTKRLSVKPLLGRGALFDSQQYHCGNKVFDGYKYLLRTDVMVNMNTI